MPPTHITVSAPAGRRTPIHGSDGADPGNTLLYVEPGSIHRVRYSGDIRRAITRGDLILVDGSGKPTDELEKASAPKALERSAAAEYLTADASYLPTFDTSDSEKGDR